MTYTIPRRYKPLLVAAIIAALTFATYIANVVFAEPDAGPCCATESVPTPYRQVPAESAP